MRSPPPNRTSALIVLDINLPDIDGLEVCRRLRARSHTAFLPIVHLTATFVAHDDHQQGLSAGGDSYLTHPVDPPVLIATVRALLFARQADIVRAHDRCAFPHGLRTGFERHRAARPRPRLPDVNPEFCRIAGRERDDIIGKGCIDIIAPGPSRSVQDLACRRSRTAAAGKAPCRSCGPTAASPKSSGASWPKTVTARASPSPPMSPNAKSCWRASAPRAPRPSAATRSRTNSSRRSRTSCAIR